MNDPGSHRSSWSEILIEIISLSFCLEAFPMNDPWSTFVVLLFADPHVLKGGEISQDGAPDPHGVLSFRRSDDLNLHGGWSQGGELLVHPVSEAWKHGGATRQHRIGVKVLADINIALIDTVVDCLVDSGHLVAEERRLEEGLGSTESFVADGDDLAVGELVALLE